MRRAFIAGLVVLTIGGIFQYVTLGQLLEALGIWFAISFVCAAVYVAFAHNDDLDDRYRRFQQEYERQQRGLPAHPRPLP